MLTEVRNYLSTLICVPFPIFILDYEQRLHENVPEAQIDHKFWINGVNVYSDPVSSYLM
ncbi:hypothetical protein CDL12_23247 [Handroanthus impetiginosus]|uniref:Uncharacterized protein n=1 Tax=Handroanthus impetiginosus TaxID=429701 RepID=A0A2G9GGT6_9LAMI|nr:hypothetical protein CDL12_23247 [Handroanthus impetiginosus]